MLHSLHNFLTTPMNTNSQEMGSWFKAKALDDNYNSLSTDGSLFLYQSQIQINAKSTSDCIFVCLPPSPIPLLYLYEGRAAFCPQDSFDQLKKGYPVLEASDTQIVMPANPTSSPAKPNSIGGASPFDMSCTAFFLSFTIRTTTPREERDILYERYPRLLATSFKKVPYSDLIYWVTTRRGLYVRKAPLPPSAAELQGWTQDVTNKRLYTNVTIARKSFCLVQEFETKEEMDLFSRKKKILFKANAQAKEGIDDVAPLDWSDKGIGWIHFEAKRAKCIMIRRDLLVECGLKVDAVTGKLVETDWTIIMAVQKKKSSFF